MNIKPEIKKRVKNNVIKQIKALIKAKNDTNYQNRDRYNLHILDVESWNEFFNVIDYKVKQKQYSWDDYGTRWGLSAHREPAKFETMELSTSNFTPVMLDYHRPYRNFQIKFRDEPDE